MRNLLVLLVRYNQLTIFFSSTSCVARSTATSVNQYACSSIVETYRSRIFDQLILFFSKSLLRHPKARSDLNEMTGETNFQRYLPEPHPEDALVAPEEIKRHILCTGQVYFALLQAREERGIRDIAISRVEQISPFPYDLVRFFVVAGKVW